MPIITNVIDGGLDLLSPPVTVQTGRLQDCENFEVALNQGVRKMDGYERFDGGVSPTITAGMWVMHGSDIGAWTDDIIAGDYDSGYMVFVGITVGGVLYDSQLYGAGNGVIRVETIKAVSTGASTADFYFVTNSPADAEALYSAFNGIGGYSIVTPINVGVVDWMSKLLLSLNH